MTGNQALTAVADAIERIEGEITKDKLVTAIREAAEGVGYSEWEDRMGDDL